MEMNRRNIHAIILAAGISERMGMSKPLLPARGTPLLGRLYNLMSAAGVAPIHIVLNPGVMALLTARWHHSFPLAKPVLNHALEKGQMHSLRLGLMSAQAAGAAAALVTLVDHPFVRPETIRSILNQYVSTPDAIIVPQYAGRNGHPYLLPLSCFGCFLQSPPHTTARDILRDLSDSIIHVVTNDPCIVTDMDTPADFVSCLASLD